MKKITLVSLIILITLNAFAQIKDRELISINEKIKIGPGTTIEEINTLIGSYTLIKIGDSNKLNYIWKNNDKEDLSAFFQDGAIILLIIRSNKYSYKGLTINEKKERIKELFGEPTSERSEGANTTYYYKDENIRIDVSNRTNLVFGIFLYYFIPSE